MDIIRTIKCECPGERAMLLAAVNWVVSKRDDANDRELGELFPTIEDWADLAGVGLSSAKKYLKALRERGVIQEKGGEQGTAPRGGRGRVTHYIIVPIAKGLAGRSFSTTDRQDERVSGVDPLQTERVSLGDGKGLCGRFPSTKELPKEPPGALERSQKNLDLERSGAPDRSTPERTSDEDQRQLTGKDEEADGELDIKGALCARGDVAAYAKVREWHRRQSEQLLRKGLGPYVQAGRVRNRAGARSEQDVEGEIRSIAAHPQVTPAAVEIALNRLRDTDEAAPVGNIIGYLIKALGALKGGSKLEPYESDKSIVANWKAAETKFSGADLTLHKATKLATEFTSQITTPFAELRREARDRFATAKPPAATGTHG